MDLFNKKTTYKKIESKNVNKRAICKVQKTFLERSTYSTCPFLPLIGATHRRACVTFSIGGSPHCGRVRFLTPTEAGRGFSEILTPYPHRGPVGRFLYASNTWVICDFLSASNGPWWLRSRAVTGGKEDGGAGPVFSFAEFAHFLCCLFAVAWFCMDWCKVL